MDKSIFKFIMHYSKPQQLMLLMLTLLSFPFLYYSLDLPKTIINDAIDGKNFPKMMMGFELNQIEYLLALCFLFLSLVFVNGGFKLIINIFRGKLGERMLRRLRYMLYTRVLRFPQSQFKKTSQGEIISMVTAEVEPLGGYIGEAISLPAFQGGTLITILAFIMIQDVYLGFAAIALYPVQMVLIPKLQRRVNVLGKERVQAVRKLSERIGETVSNIQEIHVHASSERELSSISSWLGKIYTIRVEIYQRKFFIKFLNNFIAQMTPFLFYSIGGVLVIKGSISFGALVAVLAAYKDLSPPWKELLRHYQTAADAHIKYDQLTAQFHPDNMLDENLQQNAPDETPELSGPIVAQNLVVTDDNDNRILDGLNINITKNTSTAIISRDGDGADAFIATLLRLMNVDNGSIKIGHLSIQNLHEQSIGRHIGYADHNAFTFSGSVRDNLFYGLRHHLQIASDGNDSLSADCENFISEAKSSGNSILEFNGNWTDLKAAGVTDRESLLARTIDVLEMVEFDSDIYQRSLQSSIAPEKHPELTAQILKARAALKSQQQNPEIAALIEPFDRGRYNHNMTVAENIIMGTPIGSDFDLGNMGRNQYMLSVLDQAGLREKFLETGLTVAETMVELFQDLPPDHEFFSRYSFIAAEDLPIYQDIIRDAGQSSLKKLDDNSRTLLMNLPFMLIPKRHRLGLATDEVIEKIMQARIIFADNLPASMQSTIAFYNESEYNAAASIQDNILFGKIAFGRQHSLQHVNDLICDVIEQNGIRSQLINIGLDSDVGIAGSKLSTAQRQKLCLARNIIKQPDMIIMQAALNALDKSSADQIMNNVMAEFKGRTFIATFTDLSDKIIFDHHITLKNGKAQ